MQIDFSAVIKTLEDQPVLEKAPDLKAVIKALSLEKPQAEILAMIQGSYKELTLGGACINALMMPEPQGKDLTGEEKLKRLDLALAIQSAAGPLDLTAELVTLLKRLVNQTYPSPLVVARAWNMIEGTS